MVHNDYAVGTKARCPDPCGCGCTCTGFRRIGCHRTSTYKTTQGGQQSPALRTAWSSFLRDLAISGSNPEAYRVKFDQERNRKEGA